MVAGCTHIEVLWQSSVSIAFPCTSHFRSFLTHLKRHCGHCSLSYDTHEVMAEILYQSNGLQNWLDVPLFLLFCLPFISHLVSPTTTNALYSSQFEFGTSITQAFG